MSYRDLSGYYDAFSVIRDQMDRWQRLTVRLPIDEIQEASQALTRKMQMLTQPDLLASCDRIREAGEALTLNMLTQPEFLAARDRIQDTFAAYSSLADELHQAQRPYQLLEESLDRKALQVHADLSAMAAEVERQRSDLLSAAAVPRFEIVSETVLDHLKALHSALAEQARFGEIVAARRVEVEEFLRQSTAIDRLAQDTLATFDWRKLHAALGPVEELRKLTDDLSTAYQRLKDLAKNQVPSPLDLTIGSFPGIEIYAHMNLLRGLAWEGSTEPAEEEEPRRREEIAEESGGSLLGLLSTHRPDLLHMRRGAGEAVASGNPDRVRQYCASMRQLLLELLRTAAPDTEIRKWTTDPRHYQELNPKNQPTWRARIEYLCNRADRRRYTHFVVRDAASALGVYRRLNKGVHAINAGFSSRQVTDLQIRSDNLILFVLLISIETRH